MIFNIKMIFKNKEIIFLKFFLPNPYLENSAKQELSLGSLD